MKTINIEDPCKNCSDRKGYAKIFDIHFWGADCPYECEKYKRYKQAIEQEKAKEIFWDSISEAELMEPMRHFKD